MIEEKLSSILFCLVLILGIATGLGELSFVYIFLFIIVLTYLTYRLNLIFFEEHMLFKLILIFSTIFLLGLLRGIIWEYSYEKSINHTGLYNGAVKILEIRSNNSYIGQLEALPKCKVLLNSDEKYLPGTLVIIKGNLKIPKSEMNKGSFSYKNYLKFQQIYLTLTPVKISVVKENKDINYYLYVYKQEYLKKLEKHLGDNTKYVKSIFLGDRDCMTKKEILTWKNLGILHLQAVSGSQVGIAIDLILFIFVLTPKNNLVKYIIFLIPLFFYGVMTNSPSVWRVILFLIIIKIFQHFNIEKYEMLALMISAIILVIINPGTIFQIAFQLSYVITVGLLLYTNVLNEIDKKSVKILVSGIISIAFSLPILLYYFQEIQLFTIIATPIFGPIIQIIILIAGIYLICPFLIEILYPLNYLLDIVITVLVRMISFFDNIKLPIYRGSPWPVYSVAIFYLILVFSENRVFRMKYLKKILILMLISSIAVGITEIFNNDCVIVSFINVGQGDSILIQCKKSGKCLLIDGGIKNDTIDMGEQEVIPYLRRKGIEKIDILVSTHWDSDHRGGLETVLEEMKVDMILIPDYRCSDKEYQNWIDYYRDKITYVKKGFSLGIGEIALKVLNPVSGSSSQDSNESSIVMEICYGKSNILLTSDCNIELLENIYLSGNKYDIIKAPHHGSIKSYRKEIYRDLSAKGIVFSVGINNYGHPGRLILDDLVEEGIKYYRTDRDKDIIVKLYKSWVDFNGRKLKE